MINLMTKGQIVHAVHMWAKGCDTFTIAEYFNVPEKVVYSELPKYRKQFARIGEIAA